MTIATKRVRRATQVPRIDLAGDDRRVSAAGRLLVGFIEWFVIRVEVNPGSILVLVNKTGLPLPPHLAPSSPTSGALPGAGGRPGQVHRENRGVREGPLQGARYEFCRRPLFPQPLFLQGDPAAGDDHRPERDGRADPAFRAAAAFPKTVATLPDERGRWRRS